MTPRHGQYRKQISIASHSYRADRVENTASQFIGAGYESVA
jgi:hypothetical protein